MQSIPPNSRFSQSYQPKQQSPSGGSDTATAEAHPSLEGYNRLLERCKKAEAFLRWEDELFSNPHLSGNHKLETRQLRRAVEYASVRDGQGRARINLTTIAEKIGVSSDTVSRGLQFLEQCGIVADHDTKKELHENGEIYPRHYVSLNSALLESPSQIVPPAPRNHGGARYQCANCGSEKVKIRRKVTIFCTCCQHESLLVEDEREQETDTQDQEPVRNLPEDIKPVSPPVVAMCAEAIDPEPSPTTREQNHTGQVAARGIQDSEIDDLQKGASLLLAIAGNDTKHIEMSRTSTKKYYEVKRPLTLADCLSHLRGGKARGASIRYAESQTRALCFDTDDERGWDELRQAATLLASAGLFPILEQSPAGRGGHLWLIFDDLVDVTAARSLVVAIAPSLSQVKEYWPGSPDAKNWNRVRLPGGKYVRPGVSAWCQLISVLDGEVASNGLTAAKLLISHQTPASLVPAIQADHFVTPPRDVACEKPAAIEAEKAIPLPSQTSIDETWRHKYNTQEGKRLWFRWDAQYLAAWYNARHSVDELLPSEKNGYGLASWRGERTASVAKDQDRWADFGASARRNDGSPDTGDALELQVRISETAKSDVMRQAAKELVQEARNALESAAGHNEPLPAWLREIITEAGQDYYHYLLAKAGYARSSALPASKQENTGDQLTSSQVENPPGGLTGFSQDGGETIVGQVEQPTPSVVADATQACGTSDAKQLALELSRYGIRYYPDKVHRCGCCLWWTSLGELSCCACEPGALWTAETIRRIRATRMLR